MTEHDKVVHPITVKKVKITDLETNPHNPRMLFDPDPMAILAESIAKVGILVPLTVYERKKRPGRYVILDGQRRYICAQQAELRFVPVNIVAEPSTVQNIVTMFNIHKLREDWELMPTALKVEVLMRELDEKNDRKLAELTGMDEAVVVRCKKLLSFPKRYQEMMLAVDPAKRWKADFFIELYSVRNDRVVNSFDWFHKNDFTDAMIEKKNAKALASVTEFRIVKQHISNASKSNKVPLLSKRFKEFVEHPEYKVDHLEIEGVGVQQQVRKMRKDITKFAQTLSEIDVEEFYGEDDFWSELEDLSKLIRTKLRELGWRVA